MLNFNILELLLGLSLGFGYLTSFRFWGVIGISEILMLFFFLLAIIKSRIVVDLYARDINSLFNACIIFVLVIVSPIVTVFNYYAGDGINDIAPMYIPSFAFSACLYVVTVRVLNSNYLNLKYTAWVFFLSFFILNIIFGSPFSFVNISEEDYVRYTGGANNPNQLGFYATSLLLMLVMYLRKYAALTIPCVVVITLLSRSDSFLLSIVSMLIIYVLGSIIFYKKLKFNFSVVIALITFLLTIVLMVLIYSAELSKLWLAADEGDVRTRLFMNAMKVISYSPILGFGVGSYSGVYGPFEGWEAHNTFLDLGVQFGIFVALSVYGIIFSALYAALKRRDIILVSFISAYVINSMFHFSGRHFNFWIELAIFANYYNTYKSELRK